MNTYENRILNSARKLYHLEKEYLRRSYELPTPKDKEEFFEYVNKLWELGSDAFDIKNEILSIFPEVTNLQIHDDSVRKILNKIRDKEVFYSISFFENWSKELEKQSGKNFDFAIDYIQFIETKYDDWHDDFYQRFHLTSYYKAIIEIGPIISASYIPDEAQSYFDEIRETYAIGFNYSAIALCRSVMEMCLFDKLQKNGFFKQSMIIKLNAEREDKLHYLINNAKKERILDDRTRETAHEIRIKANCILHAKKRDKQDYPNKLDTMQIITSTIRVIEKIYS